MATHDPIVIVGMARTPLGAFQGELFTFAGTDLGSAAISAAVDRAGLAKQAIEEVLMGCVLPAGQGQAPLGRPLWAPGFHFPSARPR